MPVTVGTMFADGPVNFDSSGRELVRLGLLAGNVLVQGKVNVSNTASVSTKISATLYHIPAVVPFPPPADWIVLDNATIMVAASCGTSICLSGWVTGPTPPLTSQIVTIFVSMPGGQTGVADHARLTALVVDNLT